MKIKCKCIHKHRDNKGKILKYTLCDSSGNTLDASPEFLKAMIKNNHIAVTNLKLTSDNRLIEVTEKLEKLHYENFLNILEYFESKIRYMNESQQLYSRDHIYGLVQTYKDINIYIPSKVKVNREDRKILLFRSKHGSNLYINLDRDNLRLSVVHTDSNFEVLAFSFWYEYRNDEDDLQKMFNNVYNGYLDSWSSGIKNTPEIKDSIVKSFRDALDNVELIKSNIDKQI